MSNDHVTEDGTRKVVVVGAGLAGVRTAEELRRAGFDGEIVLVGAEEHLPYDRPPLSKDVIRGERENTTLRQREFFDEQRIDLRLGVAVESLDAAARTVVLVDGTSLGYDELIVATGLRPRRIPGLPELAGVHVLRSVEDSVGLRADITPGGRALIVGAGFIGCEVAASLRACGMDVVLVEPQPTPLASVLGTEVGTFVERLHTAEGVDVRSGVGLAELRGEGRVTGAVLGDGTEIAVDLVVLGIGSVPVTEFLEGSGIELDNGVVCDSVGRTSADHVWAVGDVASWQLPDGGRKRVEHWTSAGEQAAVLAKALLGAGGDRAAQVPYFWSDQYDVKIQGLGAVSAQDTVHVVRDDGRKFLVYYERDGRLVGVVGGGLPAQVMKTRAKIAAGAPIEEMLAPTS
ncbi:NAD(P)/FAD-dependent oxidoreductase [Rhodococcus zopfii]|uniref:NAD(P)/FAD-dependent oxidoreductase n=1 Tax=Rhodococcus zopfii TaxID=43772 RepID=UPI003662B669